MAWWSRKNKAPEFGSEKRSVPSGLFQKCDGCATTLDSQKIVLALRCCPQCGHHFTMPTEDRIRLLFDEGTAVEQDTGLGATDPLGFRDTKSYADRLSGLKKTLGRADAFRSFVGNLHDLRVALGIFQFEFMGGSMGSVVGEKIARLFERAASERVPAVILSASGGARMQEGILSLMQMAKTSAALGRLLLGTAVKWLVVAVGLYLAMAVWRLPAVPVLATLDLHCNVSWEMVAQADMLCGFLTNPHVDQAERGAEEPVPAAPPRSPLGRDRRGARLFPPLRARLPPVRSHSSTLSATASRAGIRSCR